MLFLQSTFLKSLVPFFWCFVMYSTWRIAQLKEELKKRGASLRGKKGELAERLEAYDRNFNFENECLDSPEPLMEYPPDEMFRDVNSNTLLPPITKEQIHFYFSRFNKKTDDGFNMYESRYLLVLRSCQLDGDTYFLKGICKASMKKLQYEVNIKVLNDGSPEEATCECAVGRGKEAHCKHVAVVMFAAEHMKREKQIFLHPVCTQQLQAFHKPKKVFTASPVKAERLPSKRKLDNVLFHPYPVHLINKENYTTRITNICIGASTSTMPLKQTRGPANPYGILNDHDYASEDSRDMLLKNLKIKEITKDEISFIEKASRGQVKNPIWHKNRENRITASRFHTVCLLSPQRQDKFSEQLLYPASFTSRATTHGLINEAVAIKEYSEQFGLHIRECGIFISQLQPFLAASPDGLLGDETIIEVKCPYSSRYQYINETTVPYLYLDSGELALKTTSAYYYQVQGQLYCADKKYCNFIVYTFKEIKVVYITRDEPFINRMIAKLVSFYENYFKEALYKKYIYRNYK